MKTLSFLIVVFLIIVIWLFRRYIASYIGEIAKVHARKLEKDQEMQRALCVEIKDLLTSLREDIENKRFTVRNRQAIWKNQHHAIAHKLSLLGNTPVTDMEALNTLPNQEIIDDISLSHAFSEYEKCVVKLID